MLLLRLSAPSRPTAALVVAALAVCALLPGCVRRRLTIRSTPPGALVYIDDQEIGYTPVSTSYVYYGTRKIQLIKDGYKTETAMQSFPPPWYEVPPLDFVSENVWPYDLRDERVLDFQLVPQVPVPREQLLSQAENLRAMSRSGMVNPLPAGVPVVPPAQPPVQSFPPSQPLPAPAGAQAPQNSAPGGLLAPPSSAPPSSGYPAPVPGMPGSQVGPSPPASSPPAGIWMPPR